MKKLLTVWWQDHLTAHISFKKDLWKGVVAGPARPRLRSRSRCMLSEYTGLTTTSRSRPSDASTRIRKKRKLMQAWFSASFLFSTDATRLSPIRYYPWCIPLSTYNHVGSQNAQKWQFVWASPPVAFAAPRMIFFLFFSFFKRRNARVRNQKRHLFFSLFRLFHRRVFGGRWRNEMVFFSLFSLKIPLFKGFFRDMAVLFSYKRREEKWCFFV